MKSLAKIFLATLLVPFVVASSTQRVGANNKPNVGETWPICSASQQEYCIETFEFTPVGGVTRDLTDGSVTAGPTISVNLPYEASWSPVAQGMSPTSQDPQISINFYNPLSPAAQGATSEGLDEGAYRVVLRIGEFDPSMLLLRGYLDNYIVSRGTDGYYSVDFTIRPIAIASVVQLNGDNSMLTLCQARNWDASCIANQAVLRYLNVSLMMSQLEEQRLSRGSWIATNASMFGSSQIDLVKGTVFVTAAGPHYAPDDFNLPNVQRENGKILNPAYFEMFVTYDMLVGMFGKMTGQVLTSDLVKQFLSQQASAVQTTIQQSGSEVAQAATSTLGDTGLRINFNLTHYSAPNPKVTFRPGASIPGAAKTAKKGKTVSAKKLVTVPKGQTIKSIAIAKNSKRICSAKGTSVKMLKKGTCKFSVTVANKKGKRSRISGTVLVS